MVTGTIGGAARLLNVSAPGISRLVKYTEKSLGIRFFQRHRGGFVEAAMRGARADRAGRGASGAEEAMPTFAQFGLAAAPDGAHLLPDHPAWPHFGLLGAGALLPAKFSIRFLPPCARTTRRATVADGALLQDDRRRACAGGSRRRWSTCVGQPALRVVRMSARRASSRASRTYWGGRIVKALSATRRWRRSSASARRRRR